MLFMMVPCQGMGFVAEVGESAGKGFNINVPWSKKGVGNGDYMAGGAALHTSCPAPSLPPWVACE